MRGEWEEAGQNISDKGDEGGREEFGGLHIGFYLTREKRDLEKRCKMALTLLVVK